MPPASTENLKKKKKKYVEDMDVAASIYAGLPGLEADTNAVLDVELSLNELYTAVMSLRNGKAPGFDILPAVFYKSFWSAILQILQQLKELNSIENYTRMEASYFAHHATKLRITEEIQQ